jgi:hypothetical protein
VIGVCVRIEPLPSGVGLLIVHTGPARRLREVECHHGGDDFSHQRDVVLRVFDVGDGRCGRCHQQRQERWVPLNRQVGADGELCSRCVTLHVLTAMNGENGS